MPYEIYCLCIVWSILYLPFKLIIWTAVTIYRTKYKSEISAL